MGGRKCLKQIKFMLIYSYVNNFEVLMHLWRTSSCWCWWVQSLIPEACRARKSHPQITVMNRSIPLSSRVYKASFGLPSWYMERARSHLAFSLLAGWFMHTAKVPVVSLRPPAHPPHPPPSPSLSLYRNNLVTDDVKADKVQQLGKKSHGKKTKVSCSCGCTSSIKSVWKPCRGEHKTSRGKFNKFSQQGALTATDQLLFCTETAFQHGEHTPCCILDLCLKQWQKQIPVSCCNVNLRWSMCPLLAENVVCGVHLQGVGCSLGVQYFPAD